MGDVVDQEAGRSCRMQTAARRSRGARLANAIAQEVVAIQQLDRGAGQALDRRQPPLLWAVSPAAGALEELDELDREGHFTAGLISDPREGRLDERLKARSLHKPTGLQADTFILMRVYVSEPELRARRAGGRRA